MVLTQVAEFVKVLYSSGLKGDGVVSALLLTMGGCETNADLQAIIPKSERRVRGDAAKARRALAAIDPVKSVPVVELEPAGAAPVRRAVAENSPVKSVRGRSSSSTTNTNGIEISNGTLREGGNDARERGQGGKPRRTRTKADRPEVSALAESVANEVQDSIDIDLIMGSGLLNFRQFATTIANAMRRHLRPEDRPVAVALVRRAYEIAARAIHAGQVDGDPFGYLFGVLCNVFRNGGAALRQAASVSVGQSVRLGPRWATVKPEGYYDDVFLRFDGGEGGGDGGRTGAEATAAG